MTMSIADIAHKLETIMWKLVDEQRQQRRQSEVAQQAATHSALLVLETKSELRPCTINPTALRPRHSSDMARRMLLNWLFSESLNLQLQPDTICLAVDYFDRLLCRTSMPVTKAQDVAAICLHLAMKMSEVGSEDMDTPPGPGGQLKLQLEMFVLQTLQWQLVVPTVYTFLVLYIESFWIPLQGRVRAFKYLKDVVLCVESRQFRKSSMAMVCVLMLERDNLLPDTCKQLAINAISADKERAAEIADAFRSFRRMCWRTDDGSMELELDGDFPSSQSVSSCTVYPDSSGSISIAEDIENVCASSGSDLFDEG